MKTDLGQLTRREFLAGSAAIAAAAIAAPGCASMNSKYPEDAYFKVNPREFVGFYEHNRQPRGIDFQAGVGAPVTAPVKGRVWSTTDPQQRYQFLFLETDLGHLIQLSGLSKISVQPNDEVTPFTIIGEEGWNAPHATQPHTHIHTFLPPFAGLDGINKGYQWYHENVNGLDRLLENPNKLSLTGSLIQSQYTGDDSRVQKSLTEAQEKLTAIGQRFSDTYVGSFINDSRNSRFFPRVLAVSRILVNGLIESPEVKREVFEFLKWYSNNLQSIGLSVPYPNNGLRGSYQMPNSDPEKKSKIVAAWKFADGKLDERKWEEGIAELGKFRSLSPLWGEASLEFDLGAAYTHSKKPDYKQARVHQLLAEALQTYKGEHPPNVILDERIRNYRNLVRSHRRIGMEKEARIFEDMLGKVQ